MCAGLQSGAPKHTNPQPVHTNVHQCIPVHTTAHQSTTSTHQCTPMHTSAHHSTPLHNQYTLMHINAYQCTPQHTNPQPVQTSAHQCTPTHKEENHNVTKNPQVYDYVCISVQNNPNLKLHNINITNNDADVTVTRPMCFDYETACNVLSFEFSSSPWPTFTALGVSLYYLTMLSLVKALHTDR